MWQKTSPSSWYTTTINWTPSQLFKCHTSDFYDVVLENEPSSTMTGPGASVNSGTLALMHFSISPQSLSLPPPPLRVLDRTGLTDEILFLPSAPVKAVDRDLNCLGDYENRNTIFLITFIKRGKGQRLTACWSHTQILTNPMDVVFTYCFYIAGIDPTVLQNDICWSLLCFETKSVLKSH